MTGRDYFPALDTAAGFLLVLGGLLYLGLGAGLLIKRIGYPFLAVYFLAMAVKSAWWIAGYQPLFRPVEPLLVAMRGALLLEAYWLRCGLVRIRPIILLVAVAFAGACYAETVPQWYILRALVSLALMGLAIYCCGGEDSIDPHTVVLAGLFASYGYPYLIRYQAAATEQGRWLWYYIQILAFLVGTTACLGWWLGRFTAAHRLADYPAPLA